MLSFTLLLSLLTVINGAYAPDEIVALPGWEGALPSKQYSGYLNYSSTHLHYWFVESEQDPINAPTVLWFNGGPGCSSLDGFIYEHGPFVVSKNFTSLSLREYRWYDHHFVAVTFVITIIYTTIPNNYCVVAISNIFVLVLLLNLLFEIGVVS